jgi:Fe2+ or Zn2+ uptake regulation protein
MSMRITKQRRAIIEVLKEQKKPLSAADLHELLPAIDLVTIYRNLDQFAQQKLIKKVQLDTQEAQYEYQKQPHHHAICTECKRVVHFTAPTEKLKKLLDLDDFEIDDVDVTVHGTCKHKQHRGS